MVYVDLNPVRAGLAERIEDIRDSSIGERLRENSAEALEAYLRPVVSGLDPFPATVPTAPPPAGKSGDVRERSPVAGTSPACPRPLRRRWPRPMRRTTRRERIARQRPRTPRRRRGNRRRPARNRPRHLGTGRGPRPGSDRRRRSRSGSRSGCCAVSPKCRQAPTYGPRITSATGWRARGCSRSGSAPTARRRRCDSGRPVGAYSSGNRPCPLDPIVTSERGQPRPRVRAVSRRGAPGSDPHADMRPDDALVPKSRCFRPRRTSASLATLPH